MNPSLSTRPPAWIAVVFVLALASCQSAGSAASQRPFDNMTPPPGHGPYTGTVADWPIWFIAHYFDAFCYSTYDCKVRYGNYRIDDPEGRLQLSSSSIGDKYPKNLSAGYGPIRNFPPPAIATWRSQDGTPLQAEVNIAEIFKDRLIRHNLRREEIPETASISPPGIILEVNDHTINVYMKAHISTKQLQKPGNRYSDFRNDLIKVFSQTY